MNICVCFDTETNHFNILLTPGDTNSHSQTRRSNQTHVVKLLAVQVAVVRLHHGVQHKVRGQLVVCPSKELVEDVEVAFPLGVLGYAILLQQESLAEGTGERMNRKLEMEKEEVEI